jgi:polar amino acid transport system substrate-binding protein
VLGEANVPRVLAIALAAAILGMAAPGPARGGEALRVCADPDNLPFSRAEGGERGLYIDLAELVARHLGARAEYTWWVTEYARRALRNTLLAGHCDVFFGLPRDPGFMSRSLALTRPFLIVGYAIAVAPDGVMPSALDDLRAHRLAVQFTSPPHIQLSALGGFQLVTFRKVEEALDALARREVDAALVWGPSAGYYNKRALGGALQVAPVAGPGFQWDVAAGVTRGNDGLRARIEGALAQLEPDIRRLADAYGFPAGPPVLSLAAAAAAPRVQLAQAPGPATDAASPSNPSEGNADAIASGRRLFNQHCSHCHAANAMSPEPTRDLRRLRIRYGNGMMRTAYETISQGRPTKGMPTWGETLDREAIWKIVSFLETVQRAP